MKIAFEHTGYLTGHLAAVGDAEVNALDLTATTEHFTSTGALEPIYSIGQKPRYTVSDIDLPVWLINGFARGQDVDGRYPNFSQNHYAVLAFYNQLPGRWDRMDQALHLLIHGKKGKFGDSLRSYFATKGILTDAQVAAVTTGFRQRRERYR